MMNKPALPLEDHVTRYCGGSRVQNGIVDGAAFMLRDNEESLSVNWLEFFGHVTRRENVKEVRQALAAKGRTLGSSAVFAVLNVGAVLEHVRSELELSLSIVHEPEEDDPSHSGIRGYTPDDHLVADLIAEAILETYPASAGSGPDASTGTPL